MRITTRQLRRIIQEGVNRLDETSNWKPLSSKHAEQLGEPSASALHGSGRNNNVMSQLHTAIDALIGALGNEAAHQELLGIVEDWDMETYVTETRGTSPKDMPSAWQQILGTCLKGKK